MKNKSQLLLLIITISFFSFNNVDNITPISNINTDFPISEKLELKPFNKYDILGSDEYFIYDSILWNFYDDGHSLGHCYDLNTGEKLSTIATMGKASYEFIDFPDFLRFIGDSIQFTTYRKIIKTFAKKDIIEKKPMNERKFSVTTPPDSICVGRIIKLPNGSVLATIYPPKHVLPIHEKHEINKKSVAIFNNNEANSYETINYDSFDVETEKGSEVDINDKIKYSYADGSIEIKDNDMAVFTVHNQFMLYTFNLNSGNVLKEKRYTKMQGAGFQTTNDMGLSIWQMQSNDKYILCRTGGYFSEEDKELRVRKEAIFVFDWDLNPIKRFDLSNREGGYYTISIDCSSVYFCEDTDDGLTLSKADLNI